MRNEPTTSMSSTQIHPMVPCGKVPSGNPNRTRPSMKAETAAKASLRQAIMVIEKSGVGTAKCSASARVKWPREEGRGDTTGGERDSDSAWPVTLSSMAPVACHGARRWRLLRPWV